MFKRLALFALMAFSVVLFSFSSAYALKIIPPRIVMGPDTDIEYVFIKNNTNQVKRYRFGWRHLAMDPDGKVINLDKFGRDKVPGYRAADDVVRFSPRSTVLPPGETQRVTVMVRRNPNMEDGEYRSHFLVEQVPNVPGEERIVPSDRTKVNVNLLVSRSFPVYIMHGQVEASLQILGATLKANPEKKKQMDPDHFVHFDIQKQGNRSVIGAVDIFCGDTRISKASKAIAVYAEGSRRSEKIPVTLPSGGCLSPRIVIKAHPDDLMAGSIYAEGAVAQ